MKFKFKNAIKDGEIEIENYDGMLRITIPGGPDYTVNRIYIEMGDQENFIVRTHNEEINAVI